MDVQKGKQKLLCALKDAKGGLEKTNIDSFKLQSCLRLPLCIRPQNVW